VTQGGVVIAGATGLMGTALAASCARDGIAVSALVRDTARAAQRLPAATLHAWDATRGSPPAQAFEGADVVVNLIGEPVAEKRWNDARKKQLRDSRVVGTRALVDALRDLPRRPRLLISASGCGYYGDRGEEILTENAQPGAGFLAELARDWEAEAMRAADIGRQWLPWIHLEDQIGLIRHVMSHEAVSGPLNCVAPEPVTNGEFARALGEVLGRPTVLKAPLFALRLRFSSELVDEVILASQRAMPVRTLETGYAFRHPLLREALAEVLDKRPHNEAAPAPTTT
jgi:NAD dependent epimerase/dehydratase family enzyme